MLKGLITLCGFYLLGDFIATLFSWPIPGSVMGMLLLFAALVIRGGLSKPLRESAQSLLPYLPLFIVPASVGILNYWDLLKAEGLPLLLIILISLIAGMPVCGWIMQAMLNHQQGGKDV